MDREMGEEGRIGERQCVGKRAGRLWLGKSTMHGHREQEDLQIEQQGRARQGTENSSQPESLKSNWLATNQR